MSSSLALSAPPSQRATQPLSQLVGAPGPLPVLDLVHLRRFTMGQAAFEREIMALFAAGLAQTTQALLAAQTASQWHMAAHTLKGSALGVGAARLAAVARDAEQMRYLSPAERGAVMSRIRSAIQEVMQELSNLKLI